MTWNRLFRGCRVLSLSPPCAQHQRLSHNRYWHCFTLLCKLRVCKNCWFFFSFRFVFSLLLCGSMLVWVYSRVYLDFYFNFCAQWWCWCVCWFAAWLPCMSVRMFLFCFFGRARVKKEYDVLSCRQRKKFVIWYHGNNVNIKKWKKKKAGNRGKRFTEFGRQRQRRPSHTTTTARKENKKRKTRK